MYTVKLTKLKSIKHSVEISGNAQYGYSIEIPKVGKFYSLSSKPDAIGFTSDIRTWTTTRVLEAIREGDNIRFKTANSEYLFEILDNVTDE